MNVTINDLDIGPRKGTELLDEGTGCHLRLAERSGDQIDVYVAERRHDDAPIGWEYSDTQTFSVSDVLLAINDGPWELK